MSGKSGTSGSQGKDSSDYGGSSSGCECFLRLSHCLYLKYLWAFSFCSFFIICHELKYPTNVHIFTIQREPFHVSFQHRGFPCYIVFSSRCNLISLRVWHVVLRKFCKPNINAFYLALLYKDSYLINPKIRRRKKVNSNHEACSGKILVNIDRKRRASFAQWQQASSALNAGS